MDRIRRLKSPSGPDLIVRGSSTLTTVLLGQGFADEIVLIVYPVLLGRGKRCFPDGIDSHEFTLVVSKATPPACSSILTGTLARSVPDQCDVHQVLTCCS